MIDQLTEEQRAQLAVYRDEAIRIELATGLANMQFVFSGVPSDSLEVIDVKSADMTVLCSAIIAYCLRVGEDDRGRIRVAIPPTDPNRN